MLSFFKKKAAKTTVEDNTVNANTVALPQSTVFILAFM